MDDRETVFNEESGKFNILDGLRNYRRLQYTHTFDERKVLFNKIFTPFSATRDNSLRINTKDLE